MDKLASSHDACTDQQLQRSLLLLLPHTAAEGNGTTSLKKNSLNVHTLSDAGRMGKQAKARRQREGWGSTHKKFSGQRCGVLRPPPLSLGS
jgi:hypothetical protein